MRAATHKVSESPTLVPQGRDIPTQPPLTPAQVLVAACDDGVRDARERQLTASGLHVRLARTGFETIVKACCHVPNLILLDASLGAEEIDVTSQLLATCPTTAHIPVVRLTPRRGVPRRMLRSLSAATV